MRLNDLARQNADGLNAALGVLRSRMPAKSVCLADQLANLNKKYVNSGRDNELDELIDDLIVNAASAVHGTPGKRRALFVIGESGSGKSTAIERAIAKRDEFAPYEDEVGRTIYPMVVLEAPGSLTLKILAVELLRAIGYPVVKDLKEGEAWHLLKEQLVFRKVLFLHIDEMQHALQSNSHATIEHVSNTMKSLLQIPNWPLHIIMSGVPALSQFRENDLQMKTRSKVMEFMPIDNVESVKKIVMRIVEVHADLEANPDIMDSKFIARLIHATGGAFGTCIELTRTAVSRVLHANAKTGSSSAVTSIHFANAYQTVSACEDDQNIFTAKDWTAINPANALKRMQDSFAHRRKSRTQAEA